MNEPRVVDVTDIIDEQRIGAFHILVVILCACSELIDGFDAINVALVAPVVSKLWHLPPGAFKSVMSIGLLGILLGGLIAGPMADRIGRKSTIIYCSILYGICGLLTTTSASLGALSFWRFMTGLGVGGAIPNAIALASEFSPRRRRSFMTLLAIGGFNLGAFLTGMVAAALIPAFGWTSVFWVGGIVPLALCILYIFAMPESARFLTMKEKKAERVAALLRRVNPELAFDATTRFVARGEARVSGFTVRHLFTGSRAVGTICIWVMGFMNQLNINFITLWSPTVFNNAGLSIRQGSAISSLVMGAGIVATVVIGWVGDLINPFLVLAGIFIVSGVFTAATGFAVSSIGLLIPVVFLAGFFLMGAMNLTHGATAAYYPTTIRSTGLGWEGGIGKVGAIFGTFLGGLLLSFGWSTSSLFLVVLIPAVLAMVAALKMAGKQKEGVGETQVETQPA